MCVCVCVCVWGGGGGGGVCVCVCVRACVCVCASAHAPVGARVRACVRGFISTNLYKFDDKSSSSSKNLPTVHHHAAIKFMSFMRQISNSNVQNISHHYVLRVSQLSCVESYIRRWL